MMESAFSLVWGIMLPFWLIGLLYYLYLLNDISSCRESQLLWLILILIFGPFAITWYKAKRRQVTRGAARGDLVYNLACHLMLPWTIYLFMLPVLVFLYILLIRGMSFWAEYLYFLGLIILIAVLPLWLITMGLLFFIQKIKSRK